MKLSILTLQGTICEETARESTHQSEVRGTECILYRSLTDVFEGSSFIEAPLKKGVVLESSRRARVVFNSFPDFFRARSLGNVDDSPDKERLFVNPDF